MKNLFTLLALSVSLSPFAQSESATNCHKRNSFSANQIKSNALTVAQIAETERYDVHYYDLDIAMDNLSTHVAGTGEIHGTANEALDSVLFELFSTFNVSDIRLNGATTPYNRVGSYIKVPVNISAGQSFAIAVDYDGTPPNGATNPLGGAGMTNGSSPSWGNQVTWSLSEPFSAYEWWPCKQSLTDKADSVGVKITVPSTCKAGSNGVLENVVDLGNGSTRYEWKHRHAIDYYLVSVAVAQYVEYNVYANPTGAVNPILIQNYIYDNPATLTNFQNDIDETVDFMELFADLYGPYPFEDEKYGHCMAPLSGGMEHQTMTTQGWFAKGLTAHELGHQWWGNNVTCASWADIWVNEGFASYSEYLMLEDLYPNEKDQHMLDVHNNVMSNPNGSVWVEDSLNENRIFSGRLTYDKGAAIVHTFRYIMNDDVAFYNALQNIQNDFADGTALGVDIRDYFEAESGINFDDAFNEWYFGEGYPTYSATWNTSGNDLLLNITHTTSSSTPAFTNPIDVKFSRSGMADTTIRFDIIGVNDVFTIPNMGNTTNVIAFDPENWVINKTGTIAHDPNATAGITEGTKEEYYEVFPNPTSGNVTINTSSEGTNNLVLLDSRGRVIETTQFENKIELDLTNEKPGHYIIQMTNENGDKRIKTVVKN
ncbi:MAG: M1 family aminopeptidase [Crocinitomicaceae bacterium]